MLGSNEREAGLSRVQLAGSKLLSLLAKKLSELSCSVGDGTSQKVTGTGILAMFVSVTLTIAGCVGALC